VTVGLLMTIPATAPCRSSTAVSNHYSNLADQSISRTDPAAKVSLLLGQFQEEGLVIFRDFLQMGEVIGHGHFGCVYKAILNYPLPTEVAVKTMAKRHRATNNSTQLFLEEALTMKELHHENVLTIIGVSCKRNGTPMLITPYTKHGDLLSYIRNENNFPTVKDLIEFGLQIAEGMQYLQSIKFIHRDLAARNCLIAEGMKIKIADFGLTRGMYRKAYYKGNGKTALPIRWMPLESLQNYKFTLKSDIWSYGIVLWELMTRGMFPYDDVESWTLKTYLEAGHRMDRPDYCPTDLYTLMQKCWSASPDDRPNFDQIILDLRSLLRALTSAFRSQQVIRVAEDSIVCDSGEDEGSEREDSADPRVAETLS